MHERIELAAGRLRLTLLPALGGSVARFDWVGQGGALPVMRGAASPRLPTDAACFPLVPFCNRIRSGAFTFRGREVRLTPNMAGDPSPIHGQGWQSPWTAQAQAADSAELGFVHGRGQWPWAYEARQTFALDPGGLSISLSCRNTDVEPMPCGLGLHPYFPCMRETRLVTRVANVWTVDENILPVERRSATGRYDISNGPACGRDLDNGYDGWSGEAVIETPGMPFSLRMRSPDARFFQLYSPAGGELFVAEPVTHANAALNADESAWETLGLRVLGPGEAMTLSMRLEVISTPARGRCDESVINHESGK